MQVSLQSLFLVCASFWIFHSFFDLGFESKLPSAFPPFSTTPPWQLRRSKFPFRKISHLGRGMMQWKFSSFRPVRVLTETFLPRSIAQHSSRGKVQFRWGDPIAAPFMAMFNLAVRLPRTKYAFGVGRMTASSSCGTFMGLYSLAF
jgi:hypothetical protein